MIHKQVKKAINILQSAYYSNAIPYPRVDNDFTITKRYDLFPHPPMPNIGRNFSPVLQKKHKVEKNNAVLFLSSWRLVTPSTIASTAETIDRYLDDNLDFITQKAQKEYEKMLEITEQYLRENELTVTSLFQLPVPFYSELTNATASGMFFFSANEMRKKIITKQPFSDNENAPISLLKTITMWDMEKERRKIRKKKEDDNNTPIAYKPMNFFEISTGLQVYRKSFLERKAMVDFERNIAIANDAIQCSIDDIKKSLKETSMTSSTQ
jgi:hypothetical protein